MFYFTLLSSSSLHYYLASYYLKFYIG